MGFTRRSHFKNKLISKNNDKISKDQVKIVNSSKFEGESSMNHSLESSLEVLAMSNDLNNKSINNAKSGEMHIIDKKSHKVRGLLNLPSALKF